ncbi:MAG: hypothetical protein V1729_05285 [Candidatus Woesearchaeota archaeon]
MPNKRWVKVAQEMKRALLDKSRKRFTRTIGNFPDKRSDASLLGLAWPFCIVRHSDGRMDLTIKSIEKDIVDNYGVHRYAQDEYDGWMYNDDTNRKKGAGYWPLLNFWMSIILNERGDKRKALRYYNKVLSDIGNKRHIPEQIFNNKIQVSVSPLAWSHAMFVIATDKLRILD